MLSRYMLTFLFSTFLLAMTLAAYVLAQQPDPVQYVIEYCGPEPGTSDRRTKYLNV